MGIGKLSRVIFNIAKRKSSPAELSGVVNQLTKAEGKSREVLSGVLIPKQIRTMLKDAGLSKPVLELGYNSHAGSVVAGVKVRDGRKTVLAFAAGLDKTRGSAPILQIRSKAFNGSEEVSGVQFLMNPNAPLNSSGNVIQAMTKRNGVLGIQSEIGNAHIMNFNVNIEGIRQSAAAQLLPNSAIDEACVLEIFKKIQKRGFKAELKHTGEKLTDFVAGASNAAQSSAGLELSYGGKIAVKAKSVVEKWKKVFKYFSLKNSKKITTLPEPVVNKAAGDATPEALQKNLNSARIKKSKIRTADPNENGPVVHYGKHKVKRYLYHLTSEENYQKILESGRLKISENDEVLEYGGVFMTDLHNLTKRWRASKDWLFTDRNPDGGIYLSLALLLQAVKKGKKIVCLRIPTKNLNHDLLKIRSQNRLARGEQIFDPTEHLKKGAPAKDSSLYKKRKEAIEYIYQEDIPLDKAELVGMADISNISFAEIVEWPRLRQNNEIKAVLRKLFEGQPEQKAIDAMV